MKRREFIALFVAAMHWPLAARAQQTTLPVIGYLSGGGMSAVRKRRFLQGLSEAGYNDGRNVTIEYRWADGRYDRLAELAAELVNRRVSVIVVPDSVVTAMAAKAATTTIPIVFGIGADPVESGLVTSLSHPGGNLTGATRLNVQLEPKRLEMLHEFLPTAHTIGLLVNPDNPNAVTSTKDMEAAALSLGVELCVVEARNNRDLDLVFEKLIGLGATGLVIAPDPFFIAQSEHLAELALTRRLPTIFQYRDFAAAGGLASYAGSPMESYRLIGQYVARILRGERPADLPIQQYWASKLELIINLKTAKSLGLEVPLPLLVTAHELIE